MSAQPASDSDPDVLSSTRGPHDSTVPARPSSMPHHGMFGVPEQVANYTILARIGKGGMASVYLARQWGPDGFARNVALKLLPPRRAQSSPYVKMFRGEARLGALIEHPNVCRVLDFGESEGHYYIALEYLVGEPFSALISRVGHDPRWLADERYFTVLARMLAQCCDGLHAAHEALDTQGQALNVVHRDVSPHNLFALYDGTTRLVDFGVARYDRREYATTIKVLRGKVAYMSPEHVTGGDIDSRSDVWSMGVVLWEVLTGDRLFRRSTEIETMRAVAGYCIPDPLSRNSAAPARLAEIALKALERDPDTRYQSAAELGADLDSFASNSGHAAHASAVRELMHEVFEGGEQSKLQLVARFRGVVSSGVFPRDLPDDAQAEPMPLVRRAEEASAADAEAPDPSADTTEDEVDIDSSELILGPDTDPSTARIEVEEIEQERPTLPRGPAPTVPASPQARRTESPFVLVVLVPLLSLVLVALAVRGSVTQPLQVAAPDQPLVPALELRRAALPQLALGVAREETPARAAAPSTAGISAGGLGNQGQPGWSSGTAPVHTGDIYVTAGEKVAVYHGDRLLGITPLRARLAEGVQTLEARYPDGRRQALSTQIIPGSMALLSLGE